MQAKLASLALCNPGETEYHLGRTYRGPVVQSSQVAFMRLRLVPLLASGGLLACLFGGLLLIERQVATLDIAPALTQGNLTDAQEKSIDLLVQSSQLLISWTFATLGAAAYIFKYAMDNRLRIGIFDIVAGCFIVVLAICSLYFSPESASMY